ncbi:hypothetical protein F2P56_031002 [Juglans regia]|uniref:Wall-associated receptor kinase 2-like n=2 Tax=Juglans regia TaxID=51240 RepID=A0A833U2X5_JUGRE|nr:wall-associated receptor kinase 2-like [Juglans regia]KAF5450672.1 hypothetical protein F2P56_031002 [Juglans regia]
MAFRRMLLYVACVVLMLSKMVAAASATSLAKPNCQNRCGDVEIPYPFGTTENCYLDDNYFINCSNSKPLRGNIEVVNISIQGELEILMFIAEECYQNSSGVHVVDNTTSLTTATFTISNIKNKFFAVGCDTYANLTAYRNNEPFSIGCMSTCQSLTNVDSGSCSGIGCCQVDIPTGLKNFTLEANSFDYHKNVYDFSPCSFAFVTNEEFKFSSDYLETMPVDKEGNLKMVLDWAIGNQTCKTAPSKPDYVCGQNAECDNPPEGVDGYHCKCKEGYEGNPYLHDGCQDIKECQVRKPCNATANCIDTEGGFTCTCPEGYEGDGKVYGTGCSRRPKASDSHAKIIIIALIAISIGLSALFVVGSSIYCGLKRKRLLKLKEKFFQQNGGLLLQQKLSDDRTSMETAKIFSAEELEKATNNYDESRVLGQGSYGTVYRGVLPDDKLVAIKKSKLCDQSQIEQFINEVIVLTQINHRNIVKLLGCCLETEVPLLVYEFITNGTLSAHIHDKVLSSSLSWRKRLKIAADTAGALAYLHFSTSTPIIHRDVKPANILLDDNYSAKVSDFGTSRLVPLDQTQLTTLVKGTLGYLDPEYFHSSQLTEKSDVYSFGVVVAELLTGKKALSFDRPESDRSLAVNFSSAVKEDRLHQILENHIVRDGNINEINEVAKLVKQCLSIRGDDRPNMKEVAMELEGLRSLDQKHQRGEVDLYTKEAECRVTPPAQYSFSINGVNNGCSSTSTTMGYESMRNQDLKPLILNDGR